jgi:D-arginine dehydrogenase
MARTRVLVVGGGIAGASLASELATDHDVVLLEAEASLAMHSTGRSAALLIPDYGPPPVRALTRASEPLFGLLSEELGSSVLSPRGGLAIAWDTESAVRLALSLKEQGTRLTPIPRAAAVAICPVLSETMIRHAAFDDSTRDIDVMALQAAYVSRFKRLGGKVEVGAAIATILRGREGWRLSARDGRAWEGDVVVNATGAWGDQLAELCGVAGHDLQPRRRTIVVARSSTSVNPTWPLVQDAGERWYFKPEGDAVLLSPEDQTPVPPGDPRPDPLDVATGLERVNEVTSLGLRSVRTSWAGLRTFAPDGAPVVGWHPEDASLFCFLGQGGYGIQMAPALAALGAQILRSGETPDAGLQAALDPRRTHPPELEPAAGSVKHPGGSRRG